MFDRRSNGKYDMIVLNEEIVRANVLTGVSLPSATHSSNVGTCGGSQAGSGGGPICGGTMQLVQDANIAWMLVKQAN